KDLRGGCRILVGPAILPASPLSGGLLGALEESLLAATVVKRGARTHACRAETSLGACAWTVASANKRRDESPNS
ncbi:MAG TPA: hypothetical protein VJK29_20350, partial [Terriglobales bacterium]|nr:hypothetical protein [Terriglobales bacterium]